MSIGLYDQDMALYTLVPFNLKQMVLLKVMDSICCQE